IEGDIAIVHGGRGGTIVLGAVDPGLFAGSGIEGVELVAAETAAEKDATIHNRRRRQGVLAGNHDFPALLVAVFALEFDRVTGLAIDAALGFAVVIRLLRIAPGDQNCREQSKETNAD